MNETDSTPPLAALHRDEVFNELPPLWPQDLCADLNRERSMDKRKLVVLDDDPTGTQSVHHVPVLTEWSVDSLRRELAGEARAIFVLTNSRSLPLRAAQSLNQEVAANLQSAAQLLGYNSWSETCVVVSRSDSTLRGHFPGETDTLTQVLGEFDALILIPFFDAGGRYTINDVHYVAERDLLVPSGETPFARDAAFGYRASNIRAWVEEKTEGRIPAAAVASISLTELRHGGPDAVTAKLESLTRGQVCVVNAVHARDLEVFTLGLLRAEACGRRYLFRTAAPFVATRAGIEAQPLLNLPAASEPRSGGLVVVGSYVAKSSEQLSRLVTHAEMASVEISVESLLAATRDREIQRVIVLVEQYLGEHQDVVVFTSRRIRCGETPEHSLTIGRSVSDALVKVVRALKIRPRYLVAKGGITSSDLAVRALDVKRAWVLGQILPGIPVWKLGGESRWPDLPYVVFPGNVGGPDALAQVVAHCRGTTELSAVARKGE